MNGGNPVLLITPCLEKPEPENFEEVSDSIVSTGQCYHYSSCGEKGRGTINLRKYSPCCKWFLVKFPGNNSLTYETSAPAHNAIFCNATRNFQNQFH